MREELHAPPRPPEIEKEILCTAREQSQIPADRRRIHCLRALGDETQQIMRPARFWAGAGKALAAEWLHTHRRADHAAVDVKITRTNAAGEEINIVFNAAVHAKGKTEAGGVDIVRHAL